MVRVKAIQHLQSEIPRLEAKIHQIEVQIRHIEESRDVFEGNTLKFLDGEIAKEQEQLNVLEQQLDNKIKIKPSFAYNTVRVGLITTEIEGLTAEVDEKKAHIRMLEVEKADTVGKIRDMMFNNRIAYHGEVLGRTRKELIEATNRLKSLQGAVALNVAPPALPTKKGWFGLWGGTRRQRKRSSKRKTSAALNRKMHGGGLLDFFGFGSSDASGAANAPAAANAPVAGGARRRSTKRRGSTKRSGSTKRRGSTKRSSSARRPARRNKRSAKRTARR